MQERDSDESERRSRLTLLIVSVVVASPVLYVLSVGPYFWLGEHGYLDTPLGRAFSNLYWPMAIAYHRFSWLKAFVDWYVAFWV